MILLYKAVLVSGTVDFLGLSPAVSDLATVHRIFEYQTDKMGVKQRIFPVLSLYLMNPMILQIFCDSVSAHVRCRILLIDYPDRFRFFLIDL